MRGGEKCLEEVLKIYPEADVYTMLYYPDSISEIINKRNPQSSRFQKIPGARKYYRYFLPFYPKVAEEISAKLNDYDLVVSISHAWAKNIKVEVPHLCYCLSPMRYIWDQYQSYFGGRKIEPIARRVAKRLRVWDRAGAENVTQFYGISEFIQKRIKSVYDLPSGVIYPPVTSDWITPRAEGELGEGFLVVNALVPYKNTDIIIEAFNKLALPLKVVGRGPELARA